MDPNENLLRKDHMDDADDQHSKVKFYLSRDSGGSFYGDEASGETLVDASITQQTGNLVDKSGISAQWRRRRFSQSCDTSIHPSDSDVNLIEGVPQVGKGEGDKDRSGDRMDNEVHHEFESDTERVSSDDTLTSLDSNATIERSISDEGTKNSYSTTSNVSRHLSDKEQLRSSIPESTEAEHNVKSEDVSNEANDKVTIIVNRSFSAVEKRHDFRKCSDDSGYCTGFSTSRSSSNLETFASTNSLLDIENEVHNKEKRWLAINFLMIADEIDPIDIVDELYKKQNIVSDNIDEIRAIPSRMERSIEFLLLILTSDIECIFEFHSLLKKSYKKCYQLACENKTPIENDKSVCKLCSTKISQLTINYVKTRITHFNVDFLLLILLEMGKMSPEEVRSLRNEGATIEERMEVVSKNVNKMQGVDVLLFLRKSLDSKAVKSPRRFISDLLDNTSSICCENCADTMKSVFQEERNFKVLTLGLQCQFFDSTTRIDRDHVGVLRLDLKENCKQAVEVLSRKRLHLNDAIQEYGEIETVFIGSIVLVLTFTNRANRTVLNLEDKVLNILKKLFDDEEVKECISNNELNVCVSVCDKDLENDIISKKVNLLLNMSFILEEIDAIHFKQQFERHNIMTSECFHSQFKIDKLTRRQRSELLLEYVLHGDSHVIDVFMEVINNGSYQVLANKMEQSQHNQSNSSDSATFRNDLTCPMKTKKEAIQHNELQTSRSEEKTDPNLNDKKRNQPSNTKYSSTEVGPNISVTSDIPFFAQNNLTLEPNIGFDSLFHTGSENNSFQHSDDNTQLKRAYANNSVPSESNNNVHPELNSSLPADHFITEVKQNTCFCKVNGLKHLHISETEKIFVHPEFTSSYVEQLERESADNTYHPGRNGTNVHVNGVKVLKFCNTGNIVVNVAGSAGGNASVYESDENSSSFDSTDFKTKDDALK